MSDPQVADLITSLGGNTWHSFGAVNVTVAFARAISPGVVPLSLFMPDGTRCDDLLRPQS